MEGEEGHSPRAELVLVEGWEGEGKKWQVNQRNLWSAFRTWAERYRARERNTQQGRGEGGQW